MKLNNYWFKPKKFGYGAYPVTWEGWLVILGFIGYILIISKVLAEDLLHIYFAFLIIGIIALIYISKIKTKEKWKWN